MKNFTIIHILLFIVLMLAYTCSSAQDYVITTVGDTLRGKVKPMNFGPEKRVQVTDAQKNKKTISLFKTRAFVFNGETFHPVRSDKGYSYMKLIKEGYISIYAFQLENQTSYDGLYLVRRDGKNMEVPNLSFKKMMTKYLSDCPSVADKVAEGTLGKKELSIIIDNYNQCIDKKLTEMPVKVTTQKPPVKETPNWNALEEKLKAHDDFDGKANALEMVGEIKNKIQRGEKIPNFLTEGLKNTLAQTDLKEDLDKALVEVN
jgi:hypothetical protein